MAVREIEHADSYTSRAQYGAVESDRLAAE
jgi:hypothetical protein